VTLLLGIVIFGIYSAALLAIGGVGFTLQFGVTNVLNLAFGSILTACIFAEYGLTGHSTNIWIAMAVGAASGAVISLLLGHVVVGAFLRRGATGFGIAMVTIAISLMVQFGLEAIQGPFILAYTASTQSTMNIGGVVLSSGQLTTIIVAVVVMVAVHLLLRTTKLGLAMRATAADVSLTRGCGVSPARTRAVAWLLSGALCGICGVLLGIGEGSFSSSTGSDFFITLAAAAVLGGIGKPYGAMIGALLIGIMSQAAAAVISPSYKTIAAWIILIAVLVLRPQGILAEFASERELVA
jgi:branched-chain amino acid transport system permease protein/neutral amino acid transport system permease protein